MERHLEPLAIAANVTQAAGCRLDTVLLTFGSLVAQYRGMQHEEDIAARDAILGSLEKRWLVADQDIFIAAVVVNPFFQATPFAPGPRFVVARMKALFSSLYLRFFQSQPPDAFHTEIHDYLTASGRYRELGSSCHAHKLRIADNVCLCSATTCRVLTCCHRCQNTQTRWCF